MANGAAGLSGWARSRRQRLGDLGQPFPQLRRWARVERRHRTDDAGLHWAITSQGC